MRRLIPLRLLLPSFSLVLTLCTCAASRCLAQALSRETANRLRAALAAPELKDAHVGLSILDIGTVESPKSFPAKAPIGKPFRVLFEQDADKKFMPASNMKLFTAAIVLRLLGGEKTFPTDVIGHGLDYGLFRLSGGGDPSLTCEDIKNLAIAVGPLTTQLTSPKITGEGLIFHAETFDGKYPPGWTLDDTLWYYGPSISALAINRNQIDITITGGKQVGDPPIISIQPAELAKLLTIESEIKTGSEELSARGFEDLIAFKFSSVLDHAVYLRLSGQVAPGQVLSEGLALPLPELTATLLFAENLPHFTVAAPLNAASIRTKPSIPFVVPVEMLPRNNKGQYVLPTPSRVLARHNSPPLKVLLQRLLKNSDNLYAEMLLRDAAYYSDGQKNGTAPRAHELLKKWLIEQGIDTSSLRFEDGSGLSRYNLLTPRATGELLAAINRMNEGAAIWDALPIAATDGTLKNRMTGTAAANNVRAKTGTFSIASNLSGYVTTKNGHRLAVALFVNFAQNTRTAQKAQDKVFAILAGGTVD